LERGCREGGVFYSTGESYFAFHPILQQWRLEITKKSSSSWFSSSSSKFQPHVKAEDEDENNDEDEVAP
jgi:hypothetical protein